jgi:hypothetical protein
LISAILAALFAPLTAAAGRVPATGSDASDRVGQGGRCEGGPRTVFLGFDVDYSPRAPETLVGRLSCSRLTSSVTMHRRWQSAGAERGGWVPADYVIDLPRGVEGDAVLSLGPDRQGWFFRLGRP